MSIRPKTARRLLAIAVAGVAIVSTVGVTFVARRDAAQRRVAETRARGMAAFAAADYPHAAVDLGNYIAARPDDADALNALARARLLRSSAPSRDDLFEARARFQQLLAIDPARFDARLSLLEIYEKLGYAAEQLDVADKALAERADEPAALRARAVALSRLDRRAEALDAWRAYVAARPDDVIAQVRLVAAMRRDGAAAGEVVEEARRLAAAHADRPAFALPLAHALRDAGRDAEAVAALRPLIDAPPSDPAVALELVDALDRSRAFAEADRVVAAAAGALDSDALDAALVERLWQSARFDEVIEASGRFIARGDAPPSVRAMRALALAATGRRGEARQVVAELEAIPNDARAAAWTDALAVEFAEPPLTPARRVKALRDALSRDPANAVAYAWLGRALANVGESDQAARCYREAAARSPRWATPCVELAAISLDAGRLADAIAAAKAAYGRDPNAAATLAVVARVRFAAVESRRDADEERVLAQLVAELRRRMPDEPNLLAIQVALQCRAGDPDAARATLDAALAAGPSPATLAALYRVDDQYDLGRGERIVAATSPQTVTPELVRARADDLVRAGDARGATALVDAAVAAHPADADWALTAARVYQRAGDARAAGAWRAIVDRFPDDVAIQAAALDESGPLLASDRDAAARALERLRVAGGENGVEWRLRRIRFLMASDAADEARQALSLATELAREVPDRADVRALLAGELLRAGNGAAAIEHLRVAHEQSPANVAIGVALADALRAVGRAGDADAVLRRMSGLDFADADDRTTLADALLDAGRADAAAAMLGRARAMHALDADGKLRLAEAMAASGDAAGATALFAELTAADAAPAPIVLAAAADHARRTGDASAATNLIARIDDAPGRVLDRARARARYAAAVGDVATARAQFALAVAEPDADAALAREAIAAECAAGDLVRAANLAASAADRFPNDEALASVRAELAARAGGASTDDAALARLLDVVSRDGSRRVEADALAALRDARRAGRPTVELADRMARLAERYPASLPVARTAAEACVGAGRTSAAATIARRFAKSADVVAVGFAAQTLARCSLWDEAAAAAQRWRRAGGPRVDADAILAAADNERGNFAAALARLEPHGDALDVATNPSAVAARARALLKLGRVDEAFATLRPTLSSRPAARAIWLALVSESDDAQVAGRLAELVAATPADAVAERTAIGAAALAAADRTGLTAIAEAGASAMGEATADESVRAGLLRGELLRAADRLGDAEVALRAVLARHPDDASAKNSLAFLLVARGPGSADEAVRLAAEAVAALPDQAAPLDTLARAERAAGKVDEAQAHFRAAIRLDRRLPDPQVGLASLLAERGQEAEASAALAAVDRLAATGVQLPARLRAEQARSRDRLETAPTRPIVRGE